MEYQLVLTWGICIQSRAEERSLALRSGGGGSPHRLKDKQKSFFPIEKIRYCRREIEKKTYILSRYIEVKVQHYLLFMISPLKVS